MQWCSHSMLLKALMTRACIQRADPELEVRTMEADLCVWVNNKVSRTKSRWRSVSARRYLPAVFEAPLGAAAAVFFFFRMSVDVNDAYIMDVDCFICCSMCVRSALACSRMAARAFAPTAATAAWASNLFSMRSLHSSITR